MIKSRLIQRLDFADEQGKLFERGCKAISTLSEEVLNALARGIIDIHRLRRKHEVGEFISRQTLELKISPAVAHHVVDYVLLPLVRGFSGRFGEDVRGDTPEGLADDIVDELQFSTAKDKDKFIRLFTLLKGEISPAYEQQQRFQTHAAGVLPSWRSIGSTVEMRAVLGTDYALGDDVEKYNPTCFGMVPVISISLQVDRGDPERFCFQTTEDELQDLIGHLRAALKEVQEYKKHVTYS